MTAAAAPLKMTTPSAVDTEVICYILKKRITDIISDLGSNEVETEEENESEYRVAFITFSSLPLPFTAELPMNRGTGEYSPKASVPGVQLNSGVSS